MSIDILYRHQRLVNTDPQRRCYNGCNFSEELRWTAWEVLESDVPPDKVEGKLKFWRELNDYAISQRGEEARTEYKAVQNPAPGQNAQG